MRHVLLPLLASLLTIALCQTPPEHLLGAFSETPQASGEVLILYGQVLDVNQTPVPKLSVEIWQTDANGVYDHPRDPSTATRDPNFQFYGTSITDEAGYYAFRTILPGEYEPRPRHIHYKVKQADRTLLTSQFYFSEDIKDVQAEGMVRAVGQQVDALLLQLVQGEAAVFAEGRIVVNTGGTEGALALTPAQAEGPYYPVVDLAKHDNDLTRVE